MSTARAGPSWTGFSGIKHLVIFGDSYSSVGYDRFSPHPTREEPLGIPFPGVTYTEPDQPNWVGHLVSNYSLNPELRVYDFAEGGDGVFGVSLQIRNQYMRALALKPEWAPWCAEDSLFVTWVGINDCGGSCEHGEKVHDLFILQEELYASGARNFLLIDVPPIHLTPAGLYRSESIMSSTRNWNLVLESSLMKFQEAHADISALMFSTHETFTHVVQDPSLVPKDEVWIDHIHPSSRMHDFVARDLFAFLNSVEAWGGGAVEDTGSSAQVLA